MMEEWAIGVDFRSCPDTLSQPSGWATVICDADNGSQCTRWIVEIGDTLADAACAFTHTDFDNDDPALFELYILPTRFTVEVQ